MSLREKGRQLIGSQSALEIAPHPAPATPVSGEEEREGDDKVDPNRTPRGRWSPDGADVSDEEEEVEFVLAQEKVQNDFEEVASEATDHEEGEAGEAELMQWDEDEKWNLLEKEMVGRPCVVFEPEGSLFHYGQTNFVHGANPLPL